MLGIRSGAENFNQRPLIKTLSFTKQNDKPEGGELGAIFRIYVYIFRF